MVLFYIHKLWLNALFVFRLNLTNIAHSKGLITSRPANSKSLIFLVTNFKL